MDERGLAEGIVGADLDAEERGGDDAPDDGSMARMKNQFDESPDAPGAPLGQFPFEEEARE